MSNAKFTFGKWEARVEQIAPTSKAECFTIATDDFDIVSPMLGIRSEHDALLMAAAPEMYEALLAFVSSYTAQTYMLDECESAEAILLKARGLES
jgi:hypothetical protein